MASTDDSGSPPRRADNAIERSEPLPRSIHEGQEFVDPDAADSWPAELRVLAGELAAAAPATPDTEDLELPAEAEDRVRELLAGRPLLVFHATRLLDHERDMVRSQGLRVFGRALFDDRIHAAHTHGVLTTKQRDALLSVHMYATGEQHARGCRENRVCLVLGRGVFSAEPRKICPLLSTWGGEGIYFSSGATTLEPLLRSLGQPTIVVVTVPVASSSNDQSCFPGLDRVFVDAIRGLDASASLSHRAAVPPQDVLDLWQPGHPAYDRYPGLPRA